MVVCIMLRGGAVFLSSELLFMAPSQAVKEIQYGHIRSNRIFQNGSETLATLLSVITRRGRRVLAHLHSAGAFAPAQERT